MSQVSPSLAANGALGAAGTGGRTLSLKAAARGSRSVSRALVSVACGETPEIDAAVRADPTELVTALRYHRLAPLAHTLLRDGGDELAELVRMDRDAVVALHLHATTLLGHLGDLLDDVPWVVFKGPVLSELAHPVPGLRSYHDLDLLVDPRDLRRVSTRLLEAGWTIADYDDMLRNPEVPGEMHWRSPSGMLMDLHWSMINTLDRRRRLAVPTAELLRRRQRVRLGFSSTWILDPADGLVHVCLHAALTGANKLIYLVDAQLTAARVTDWPEVGRRANLWKAAPHLALVLRRARSSLGGDLPEGLDRLLGTSAAFRGLTTAVDRLAPVHHARTEPGVARLVARAVQPGALRTAAASARSGVRYVFDRRQTTQRGRVEASPEALQLYLHRVEAAR